MGGIGSGAKPGQGHGGRKPGSLNKFTIGRLHREAYEAMRANTIDGALENVSRLMGEMISDPQDRQSPGMQ